MAWWCVVTAAVEHCECGHTKGDHKSSGSLSLIVEYGVCLVGGCDCIVFTKCTEDEVRDAA
jgi:hypothetical protein